MSVDGRSLSRKSDHPMLNLKIFKNRRFGFACLSSLLNFVALYSVVFLTPWFLADALAFDVLRIGTTMMAFAIVTFFMGPISGALSDRIGSRGLGFTGMIVLSIGLFMFSRLTADAKTMDIVWRLAVCGLGGGLFQSPMNSAAMGSAPGQFLHPDNALRMAFAAPCLGAGRPSRRSASAAASFKLIIFQYDVYRGSLIRIILLCNAVSHDHNTLQNLIF